MRRSLWLSGVTTMVLALAWTHLDASPTLFFYDFMASMAGITLRDSFKDKTVWVTGASSGIGAEIVCQLVEASASHVILSARRVEKMKEVVKECTSRSTNAAKTTKGPSSAATTTRMSVVPYDAQDLSNEAVDQTVLNALAVADNRTIDVLILNAGIYQFQPAMLTSLEEGRRILQVNFEAPVALSNSLMRLGKWKERQYGHIIAVASIMARGCNACSSMYAASKNALRNYFHSLSTEEYGWLRVDVACPGATQTDFWDAFSTSHDELVTSFNLGKMTAQRVAHLILRGATGPHIFFYETWITKSSGLVYVFLASYMPIMFYISIHLVGFVRMLVWEKERIDLLDMTEVLSKLFLIIRGLY